MQDLRRRGMTASRVGRSAILALFALAVIGPSPLMAHAELESSTPADGAVIAEPLTEVVLTFSEAVVGRSMFSVLDADGAVVATGFPDPAAPDAMRTTFAPLAAGSYTVQWTSVADDGDVERGTLSFAVAVPTPPAPTPTSGPSGRPSAPPSSPSAAPTIQPAATPSSDGGLPASGDSDVFHPITAVFLPILLVGVLVVGGLALLLRRGGPR